MPVGRLLLGGVIEKAPDKDPVIPETWATLVIGALAGLNFFRRRRVKIKRAG